MSEIDTSPERVKDHAYMHRRQGREETADLLKALLAKCAKTKADLAKSEAGEAAMREAILSAFAGLEHGDEKHRAWLKERFDTHFASVLSSDAGAKVLAVVEAALEVVSNSQYSGDQSISCEDVFMHALAEKVSALDGKG